MGRKNVYISVLIFICILFPPALLAPDSKAVIWSCEVLAFAASFTALHQLDGRQRRRDGIETDLSRHYRDGRRRQKRD
jgi:hypothetical protein